jgi:mannose-6-phosphate isomerase
MPLSSSSAVLPTLMVDKVWGCDVLPAPFVAPEGRRIGEVWFEPPMALPQLLVKYIFTSQKLSVQVHPSDAQTIAAGLGRQGKEECWLVIAAEPGAQLGIGFEAPLSGEAMRAAALDGSIEALMTWHDVSPGDFFYIPANTVHAIGAGVSVIEIQQNSDITYRLYDYGRLENGKPRALHLDESIAVAKGEVYDLARWHRRVPDEGAVCLVEGPLFRLDRVAGAPSDEVAARYVGPLLVVPVRGSVRMGDAVVAPGGCAVAGALGEVAFEDGGLALIAQAV